MPRSLSLKVAFAASILLVVAHAAASSHAHEAEHADEVCLVCVASADFAPTAFAPGQASKLAPAERRSAGQTVAPFAAHHAAYAARAPPSS